MSLSSERDWGTHEALWKACEPLGVSHKGDAKAREVEGVDVLPCLMAEVPQHGEAEINKANKNEDVSGNSTQGLKDIRQKNSHGESSQKGGQGVDDGDHGSVSDVGAPTGLG